MSDDDILFWVMVVVTLPLVAFIAALLLGL